MNRFSNILFVANSGQNDCAAFEQAVKLAKANQAKITVVGMLGSFASGVAVASDLLGALAEQRTEQLHVLKGQATSVVPALAKELSAELIVMGTIARTGVPGYLMGNTAETILNRIDSSVLAIKPGGFVSPIKQQAA